MAYDKNKDYQKEINDAVAKGDFAAAARAEQARNEKIKGEGITGYATTSNYSSYLKPTSSATSGTKAQSGASKASTAKAGGTIGALLGSALGLGAGVSAAVGSAAGSAVGGYKPTGSSANTSGGSFGGSSQGVNTYTDEQNKIKEQMNANSIAWHTASPEERARLEAENKELAAKLGGGVSYNSVTGTWSGDADKPLSQSPSFSYGSPAPSYSGGYESEMNGVLDDILSRKDFAYDVNADPLYQQYRSQYNREGNRAMNDTLAALSSGAGGVNSYAVTAAQQANDYYNSQLNDRVPELYQLAYSMYLDDIDNKVRDLGLLQSMDSTQYNRYRDTMNDWYNDRNFAYNIYRDDVSDYQWDKTWDYNLGRDAISDTRYNNEWNYNKSTNDKNTAYGMAADMLDRGIMPDGDMLAAAGISPEAANKWAAGMASAQVSGSRSGSGGSGGGGGAPSLGFDDVDKYVNGGGDVEDYMAVHYKDLGYSNKSQAMSAYNIHLNEQGNFDKNAQTIKASLMNKNEYLVRGGTAKGYESYITGKLMEKVNAGEIDARRAEDIAEYFGVEL